MPLCRTRWTCRQLGNTDGCTSRPCRTTTLISWMKDAGCASPGRQNARSSCTRDWSWFDVKSTRLASSPGTEGLRLTASKKNCGANDSWTLACSGNSASDWRKSDSLESPCSIGSRRPRVRKIRKVPRRIFCQRLQALVQPPRVHALRKTGPFWAYSRAARRRQYRPNWAPVTLSAASAPKALRTRGLVLKRKRQGAAFWPPVRRRTWTSFMALRPVAHPQPGTFWLGQRGPRLLRGKRR
mmetsp:Transcript_22059/g.63105  ORF Transcript_22059/g.63105 Transcript_22059/m.63105 type:complete len:240 (-) Transcript_22059:146-865(-)